MPVSDAEVADLLKALSVTQAPLVRKNVRTVLDFFRRYDPRTDRGKLLSILRATDLHTEVREELLWHGEVLGRFAATGREYGDFYTKAGTSQWILGIRPAGKQFRRFRVSRPSPVLVSRAAGVVTTWDDNYCASGGGIQYLVPNSRMCLDLIPPGDNRPSASDVPVRH